MFTAEPNLLVRSPRRSSRRRPLRRGRRYREVCLRASSDRADCESSEELLLGGKHMDWGPTEGRQKLKVERGNAALDGIADHVRMRLQAKFVL
jgi:hypothetical protein